MINEQYKKSLTRYEGRNGALMYGALFFTPLFLLIMGCLNMWLAMRIGNADGITLSDYARTWLEEIEIRRQYTFSGVFLAGMQRFNTALLQFSFAVVISPLAWGVTFLRKRDRAVVNALRKHGEI